MAHRANLRLYSSNTLIQVSHETIYKSIYARAKGVITIPSLSIFVEENLCAIADITAEVEIGVSLTLLAVC